MGRVVCYYIYIACITIHIPRIYKCVHASSLVYIRKLAKNWNIFSADLKYTLLYVFSPYNMIGWNIRCFIMSSERHLFFCAYWISFFFLCLPLAMCLVLHVSEFFFFFFGVSTFITMLVFWVVRCSASEWSQPATEYKFNLLRLYSGESLFWLSVQSNSTYTHFGCITV